MLYLLHLIICSDKKESLQRFLTNPKSRSAANYDSNYEDYLLLVDLVDTKKYRRLKLNWDEMMHLAKYYKSYQNEFAGKSVRYDLPKR